MTEETKPKLSELLRVGALKRPQGKGAFFRQGKSCALGAMYEGMVSLKNKELSLNFLANVSYLLSKEYPALTKSLKDLEIDNFPISNQESCLASAIVSLNDYHDLTREEIADRLEAKGL